MKTGDRVRIRYVCHPGPQEFVGRIGRIVSIDGEDEFTVKLNGISRDGRVDEEIHCDAENLELQQENSTTS